MLKLTAIPHPDLNGGQPYAVYVDPTHIVMIERSKTSQERYDWRTRQHELVSLFWDEVERTTAEMRRDQPSMTVQNSEEEASVRRWVERRDIAASIQAAYGIVNQASREAQRYPPVECTCIQLSVPNAQFHMLPAIYVTESPEEVAAIVDGHRPSEAAYR